MVWRPRWSVDGDGALAGLEGPRGAAGPRKLDAESLFSSLEHFARDWLLVLSGRTSIALNRLAVSHAASGRSALGEIVLSNGPVAMAERLKPILTMGKEAGLLIFDDIDEAFRTFWTGGSGHANPVAAWRPAEID